MSRFTATIDIIGINPFVPLPLAVLEALFAESGKDKGPIPVRLTLAGRSFPQTLVKYAGIWRLYLNGPMLKVAKKAVGDRITVRVEFDPGDRTIAARPEFLRALEANPEAKALFEGLSPSLRKEIVRYIAGLKSEDAIARNADRAVEFLLGRARFVGRDHP